MDGSEEDGDSDPTFHHTADGFHGYLAGGGLTPPTQVWCRPTRGDNLIIRNIPHTTYLHRAHSHINGCDPLNQLAIHKRSRQGCQFIWTAPTSAMGYVPSEGSQCLPPDLHARVSSPGY